MTRKVLMSGNEAIARGAWEAGCRVGAGYPGTPSTEVLEAMAGYAEIDAQWSPNEKVALEVVFGASLGGARALAAMKHVGVNVAMDPLMTLAYAGVNGGLVLVSADDPGMFSSQNEQDNRNIAKLARMILLEPASPQEAKELTHVAFALSERFDLPVMMRVTTRLCHGRGVVELGEREEVPLRPYVKNYEKYMMLPTVCRQRRRDLEERLVSLRDFAESFPFNRVVEGSKKIGIVTSGIASLHAREALKDASFLLLGMTYPLPEALIRRFAASVEKLYVVEELDPFLETQIAAMGIPCEGKSRISPFGELRSESIAEALGCAGRRTPFEPPEIAPPTRAPLFCPGCAHRPVFDVLRRLRATVLGDIGCYSLGAYPPFSAMDMNLCMGASIGAAIGMEKARKSAGEPRGRLVAVIGDSTFLHSGITGLADLAYNGGTVTVLLLDNATTAMTGHQDHPGSGRTLLGREAPAVDYRALAHAVGIARVVEVDPLAVDELARVLEKEIDDDTPSLVIAKSPCALRRRGAPTRRVEVDGALCRACGRCFRVGCPAIGRLDDRKALIDEAVCVGCTVCAQVCPHGAMGISSRPGDGR